MSEMLRRVTMLMRKSVVAGPIANISSALGTGTVTKPGGVVAGDFIFIGGSSTSALVWTPPSGFTDLTGGVASVVGLCYRIATGSEGSSFSYSNGGAFLGTILGTFRGASAIDVVGAYNAAYGVTNIDLPSVTTTTNADMLIAVCGSDAGVSMNAVSGMTRLSAASNPPVALYFQLLTASGPTGTRNIPVGGGSANLVGGMVAIKP